MNSTTLATQILDAKRRFDEDVVKNPALSIAQKQAAWAVFQENITPLLTAHRQAVTHERNARETRAQHIYARVMKGKRGAA